MNERIQELKRQASMWCDQNIPGEFDEETGGYGSHWEEKFALLIIQECLLHCYMHGLLLPVGDAALVKALKGIKKHFGVEE
jgi:hypothetical protein